MGPPKPYIPVGPPFATAGLGVLLLHDFERDFLAARASFNLTMQHWGLGLQVQGLGLSFDVCMYSSRQVDEMWNGPTS